MALGYYTPVIDHINAFVVAVVMLDAGTAWYCLVLLVPFGCGVLGGIFLVAKLMEYLLCRFERLTYWAIFGLLAASPVAILGKIPLRGTSPAVTLGRVLFSVGAVVIGAFSGRNIKIQKIHEKV